MSRQQRPCVRVFLLFVHRINVFRSAFHAHRNSPFFFSFDSTGAALSRPRTPILLTHMDGPPPSDCCSICHGTFHIPCQANCSHWFCGNCIMLVWDHGSTLQPCKCPLCRRQITLLVPVEASLRQRSNPEFARVLLKIENYNRHFGGQSVGLIQRMQDLPFLLRRLLREMMDPRRSLPLVIRARVYLAMLLSAIYIFSPVDIIPEAILGVVGLLDDALIALICFLHVAAMYRSVLHIRHGGS